MRIDAFSPKQMEVLCFWGKDSPDRDCQGIICDGAVRSGKTFCMGLSFFCWAMESFENSAFALCGKTIGGVRRNLLNDLLPLLSSSGYDISEKLSENLITVKSRGRSNRFYVFSGKDESSPALIQGITLSGVLFDEVALMPRAFVEQAIARCSVEGAKLWFNCNPESPGHWFYREWILRASQKNVLYLHFTMEDNPALSPATRKRYENLFTGPFYERFVLGRWVAADGLIYPFAQDLLCDVPAVSFSDFAVSCDYGTQNPASFGLWGLHRGVWYRVDEYYYSGRETGSPRTDGEHLAGLLSLIGDRPVSRVVVDPSASGFIELLRRTRRFKVLPAKNDVLSGIRQVSSALKEGRIKICRNCTDTVREFSLYRWRDDLSRDAPLKEEDHAMDDIRYFVTTILGKPRITSAFAAVPRLFAGY